MFIEDEQNSFESVRRQYCEVSNHDKILMPMLDSLPNAPQKAPFAMRPRTLSADEVYEMGISLVSHFDAEAEMMSVEPLEGYYNNLELDLDVDPVCSTVFYTPKRSMRHTESPPPMRRVVSPPFGYTDNSHLRTCKLLFPDDS